MVAVSRCQWRNWNTWGDMNNGQRKETNKATSRSVRNGYRNHISDALKDIEAAELSGDSSGLFCLAKSLSSKRTGNAFVQPSTDGNIETQVLRHNNWEYEKKPLIWTEPQVSRRTRCRILRLRRWQCLWRRGSRKSIRAWCHNGWTVQGHRVGNRWIISRSSSNLGGRRNPITFYCRRDILALQK